MPQLESKLACDMAFTSQEVISCVDIQSPLMESTAMVVRCVELCDSESAFGDCWSGPAGGHCRYSHCTSGFYTVCLLCCDMTRLGLFFQPSLSFYVPALIIPLGRSLPIYKMMIIELLMLLIFKMYLMEMLVSYWYKSFKQVSTRDSLFLPCSP